MDVAFLGDDAYALLSGAGPNWFSPSSASGVYRLNGDGTMTLVGDISAWLPDNPPAEIASDYSPDGSLFDLEAAGDGLLLSEAVGGQLLRVSLDGEIASVADLSADHLVPTGIAVDEEGNAYVGHETAAPYVDGVSKVVKVAPDGTVSDAWTGLTVVTDVALGPDGALYATEMATGFSGETAMMPERSGQIVRQTGPDTSEVVVSDLSYPVNIGFDANGQLVVSGPAFGPDAGVGQGFLASVDPAAGPISFAGFTPAPTGCA
jgi:sugar lactone lactonase YvrE